ncbi:AAA family ATPase [Sporomusa acidovorans]|uniref:ATP-dependent zinc metalloprotease FtsH n=1 Tax=Sporomusa acidovorans (strain ATCC 49682 / DSM 3132 / Mol) TaxID=1123286 RepID=A0ABZ3J4S5_SPOA4|nr:AAA family ATPase [Sporomusa acidovorans]OZC15590.1 ATP-dependent zinc metalloprotease FtsH [Sporomusa acidovorans DSM 3132]SDE19038.1 ATP-dependent metalloprotease FtsH [Sporomusa acidovorans]
MRYLELILGIVSAIVIFLGFQGIDLLPVLLFAGLVIIFWYQTKRAGEKSFATHIHNDSKRELISFDDIGGQDIAKGELREALEFIKDIERIKKLGIRPLKGILLNGPPGTGKTLLAKAAACFTGSEFLAASGSEFVEMYVGVGARRVRQLFKQARDMAKRNKKKSAVIFIDEIEVLGGKRGQNAGHMEYDQTLNELLVQMDGMSENDDVRILVIGATNRLDILDSALLRPGRFDRQVKVDLPDKLGRIKILELHTRNKPLAEEVSLADVANDTFGFSGAHLESVANEAAILAFRENSRVITVQHLRSAVEKVIMGEKLDKIPTTVEKRRIAIHETGHALLSEYIQPGSVASVTVVPRGNALGYVRQTQQEDMYLYTLDYIKGKIAVAIAGAIAEDIFLGARSTGAASDFKQAVSMAKQIIFGGMSELGIVSPDDIPKELLHNTITGIFKEVESLVTNVLSANQAAFTQIVDSLLTKECIAGSEFQTILNGVKQAS